MCRRAVRPSLTLAERYPLISLVVVSKNSDGVNCRPRYAAEWPNSPARTIYFPGNVAAAAAFSVSPPDVLRLGPPTSAGWHAVSAGGDPRTQGSPAWEAPSFYRRRTLPAGSKSAGARAQGVEGA